MVFKYLRDRVNREHGSALIMVLIMVVVLSLAMASVAMLSASASTALKNSALDAETRSAKLTDALAKTLNYLSYSSGTSVRYGLGTNDCGPGLPGAAPGAIANFSGVDVFCKAHVSSGLNTAVASLILTGTCGASCVIGTDAGLWADINPKPNDCGTASSTRLKFSAGILNVSGEWKDVNCGSLEFGAKGKITQPNTATCPSVGAGTGSWWTGDLAGAVATLAKCQSDNQDVKAADVSTTADGSTLKSFISSISDGVVAAEGTPVVEKIAGQCAAVIRNGKLTAVTGPTVIALAQSLPTCSGGDKPTIFFANADSSSMGRVMFDSYSLSLAAGLPKVIFGQPNATYDDCNTSLPGTQLQLKGSSTVSVGGYTLTMCDPKSGNPSIVAPSSSDTSASFSSSVAGDILSSDTSGTFIVRGYVFAPGGSAYLKVNTGKVNFASGAMLRGFHFFASANPDDFGNIPQPPELSGDRLVQLRFMDGTRNLGMVQVIIRDYYGRRRAVGIGIKSWRTLW